MTNLGVNLPSGPTDVMKHPEPLRKSTAATFNDERFLQLLIANACDYAGQQLSSENTPVNTIGLWEADGQSKSLTLLKKETAQKSYQFDSTKSAKEILTQDRPRSTLNDVHFQKPKRLDSQIRQVVFFYQPGFESRKLLNSLGYHRLKTLEAMQMVTQPRRSSTGNLKAQVLSSAEFRLVCGDLNALPMPEPKTRKEHRLAKPIFSLSKDFQIPIASTVRLAIYRSPQTKPLAAVAINHVVCQPDKQEFQPSSKMSNSCFQFLGIHDLIVANDHRHQSLGSEIMGFVRSVNELRGKDNCGLLTNRNHVGFFEQCGFRHAGCLDFWTR